MHPPHQPKTNEFGRKISLYFEKLVSISGCIPPDQPKPDDFGRKISLHFGEDLFFFFWIPPDFGRKKRLNFRKISLNFGEYLFFFGDHLILGGKNVRISVKTSEFLRSCALNFELKVLCLKSPPPKFSGSATAHSNDI